MKLETDYQALERAKVLLKEAGVVWCIWTTDDVRDMIRHKLTRRVDEDAVLTNIALSQIPCDDGDEPIWYAIEDSIALEAKNKLGG